MESTQKQTVFTPVFRGFEIPGLAPTYVARSDALIAWSTPHGVYWIDRNSYKIGEIALPRWDAGHAWSRAAVIQVCGFHIVLGTPSAVYVYNCKRGALEMVVDNLVNPPSYVSQCDFWLYNPEQMVLLEGALGTPPRLRRFTRQEGRWLEVMCRSPELVDSVEMIPAMAGLALFQRGSRQDGTLLRTDDGEKWERTTLELGSVGDLSSCGRFGVGAGREVSLFCREGRGWRMTLRMDLPDPESICFAACLRGRALVADLRGSIDVFDIASGQIEEHWKLDAHGWKRHLPTERLDKVWSPTSLVSLWRARGEAVLLYHDGLLTEVSEGLG